MVEENGTYQELQKICRKKYRIKFFRAFRAKYPLHPQQLPAPTPMS